MRNRCSLWEGIFAPAAVLITITKFWFVSSQQRRHFGKYTLCTNVAVVIVAVDDALQCGKSIGRRARDVWKFVVLRWEKWIFWHKECSEMRSLLIAHSVPISQIHIQWNWNEYVHDPPLSFYRKTEKCEVNDTKSIFFLHFGNKEPNNNNNNQKRAIPSLYLCNTPSKKLGNSSLEFLFVSILFGELFQVLFYQEQSEISHNLENSKILSRSSKRARPTVCNLVYSFRQLIDKKIPIKFSLPVLVARSQSISFLAQNFNSYSFNKVSHSVHKM